MKTRILPSITVVIILNSNPEGQRCALYTSVLLSTNALSNTLNVTVTLEVCFSTLKILGTSSFISRHKHRNALAQYYKKK